MHLPEKVVVGERGDHRLPPRKPPDAHVERNRGALGHRSESRVRRHLPARRGGVVVPDVDDTPVEDKEVVRREGFVHGDLSRRVCRARTRSRAAGRWVSAGTHVRPRAADLWACAGEASSCQARVGRGSEVEGPMPRHAQTADLKQWTSCSASCGRTRRKMTQFSSRSRCVCTKSSIASSGGSSGAAPKMSRATCGGAPPHDTRATSREGPSNERAGGIPWQRMRGAAHAWRGCWVACAAAETL